MKIIYRACMHDDCPNHLAPYHYEDSAELVVELCPRCERAMETTTLEALEALQQERAAALASLDAQAKLEIEAESVPAPSVEEQRRAELAEKSPEELLAMTLEALPPGTTVTSDLLAERLRAVVQAKS